jgi:hypothetical protein
MEAAAPRKPQRPTVESKVIDPPFIELSEKLFITK